MRSQAKLFAVLSSLFLVSAWLTPNQVVAGSAPTGRSSSLGKVSALHGPATHVAPSHAVFGSRGLSARSDAKPPRVLYGEPGFQSTHPQGGAKKSVSSYHVSASGRLKSSPRHPGSVRSMDDSGTPPCIPGGWSCKDLDTGARYTGGETPASGAWATTNEWKLTGGSSFRFDSQETTGDATASARISNITYADMFLHAAMERRRHDPVRSLWVVL